MPWSRSETTRAFHEMPTAAGCAIDDRFALWHEQAYMLNALSPVTLACGRVTLTGFSIAGLATYLQVPELDVVFDMGECTLSAVPLNHVLLTHAHGDHSRCVLRHHALRGMLGIPRPATYYMPAEIADNFLRVARAEAVFEGVDPAFVELPRVIGLHGDRSLQPITDRRDLFVSAFPVTHRVDSLGYTLVERRRKLKPELAALSGRDIAEMKKRGEPVTNDRDVPLMTFIGDCIGESLFEQAHIWESPIVVIEATFLSPDDAGRAAAQGHTHLNDVVRLFETLKPSTEHIVLKHFSMKHTRDEVIALVSAAIPADYQSRVKLLL